YTLRVRRRCQHEYPAGSETHQPGDPHNPITFENCPRVPQLVRGDPNVLTATLVGQLHVCSGGGQPSSRSSRRGSSRPAAPASEPIAERARRTSNRGRQSLPTFRSFATSALLCWR